MTYESTGEVRVPRNGEYYLFNHILGGDVLKATCDDWLYQKEGDTRVIMRPVREEKPTYQVVLTIPADVPESACQTVAESWVGFIFRSNPSVKPEIRKVYANE